MKVNIKGAIVSNSDKWIYDFFGMDAVCPKDVLDAIDKAAPGEVLETYINSPGGYITPASEIYAALEAYGNVLQHIVGECCSCASWIACAGKSDMVRTGMYMIHNVSGGAQGDYRALAKGSEALQVANRACAAAYRKKTGKTEQELLALMDTTKYMTAEDAVAYGFVDAVTGETESRLVNAAVNGILPEETLEKVRNMVKNPLHNAADVFMRQKAQAEYDFLNLEGKKQ